MPLNGLRELILAEGERIHHDATEAIFDDLKDAAPVATGELRDSAWGPNYSHPSEATFVADLGFSAPQAVFTDEGVGRHEISGNPLLSFFWEDGPNGPGRYVFPSVDHPGQEGTHWFSDPLEQWERYLEDEV